jgi:hypothetical protein
MTKLSDFLGDFGCNSNQPRSINNVFMFNLKNFSV